MSAAALPRVRFTREDVDKMIDAGLFAGRRLELIDGDLIEKMGQNPLTQGYPAYFRIACRGIWATARTCARPDGGTTADRSSTFPSQTWRSADAKFAGKRHPRGDEIVLVVEVADTTLRGDLTVKRDLYARAGVPEYWVLSLKGRKLIVHRRSQKRQVCQRRNTHCKRDGLHCRPVGPRRGHASVEVTN